MEITTDGEVAIASVQPPRSEEELASLNEVVDTDVSKVEVLKEKKLTPEETAEAEKAAKEGKDKK